MVRDVADASFNRVTLDGQESTNDVATVFFSDLRHDYVTLNAEYLT
jgi:N-acetylglutamate synthase/N-acetylornithine aminotransferase